MHRKILVPTDLSDASMPAIETALALAQPLEAAIELVFVIDADRLTSIIPPSAVDPEKHRAVMLEQAREALSRLMGERDAAAVVNFHTRIGSPAEEILNQARADQVDLIVMATHGRTGLAHVFLGSVAEKVVRGAHCPVMTVRTGGPRPEARERFHESALTAPNVRIPRRLLVPTDLTAASIPALVQAGKLAEAFGAELYVMHVIDVSYSSMPLIAGEADPVDVQQKIVVRAGTALREFLALHAETLGDKVVEAPNLLRMGEAPREIELAVQELWIDLVVLGRHAYRGFHRWLMGNVAEQVVRYCPCPVLTIPAAEDAEG